MANRTLRWFSILCALAGSAAASPWRYDVRLDAALTSLDARLCIDGPAPSRLVAGRPAAWRFVTRAALLLPAGPAPIHVTPRGLVLPSPATDACLEYHVDLGRMAREDGQAVERVGRDLVTIVGTWLWSPPNTPDGMRASLTLRLPEGLAAAVPWPRAPDGAWVLDESAFDMLGMAAFGRFSVYTMKAAGTVLDVARLDTAGRITQDGIRKWLAAAVTTAAGLFGTFPQDRVLVLVRTARGDGEPVVFGHTVRGGGPAIDLLASTEATDRELVGEWVAVHELLHLAMPWVEEPWLAEGFVTYYEEVLRTRAGFVAPAQLWQDLVDGFGRGRASARGRELSEASRNMDRSSFGRVYWGGAAIALLVDAGLRRATSGKRSLDDGMRRLRACCMSARTWTAVEVLAELDTWVGRPYFARLASKHLKARDFPDVSETLTLLGVVVERGKVRLDDRAPGAGVRRAIERGTGPAR